MDPSNRRPHNCYRTDLSKHDELIMRIVAHKRQVVNLIVFCSSVK